MPALCLLSNIVSKLTSPSSHNRSTRSRQEHY